MWKIYVILALWTQSLNAQQGVQFNNSGGGKGKTPFETYNIYSEYTSDAHMTGGGVNYSNTNLYTPQVPSHKLYNKNSRDSFGTALPENHSYTEETYTNVNNPNEISLSTISPFSDANSITTQHSTVLKIPNENSFSAKLFEIMSSESQYKNLVYSPISLETVLACIFTMSGGKLNEELAQLLALPNDRSYVAKTFENILKKTYLNTPPTTLVMANKLYYDNRFGPIDQNVRNFIQKSFDADFEGIEFSNSKKAANIINSWVSEKTRNQIKNIVTPSSIYADARALLLNSIYFKSEWLTKFATSDTQNQDFFITRQAKVSVKMMYNEDVFRYGDFDDLQASAMELPYKSKNLSMLLILPQDVEGLADLEGKLKDYDFGLISQKLKRETVTVKLPRFKIEFETDMKESLQQLGLNALFNDAGSINLFKNQQKPLNIDQFKHKSFINVNEVGTEAAATTVAKYVPLSISVNTKHFVADHPFVFVIRDSNTTYFVGHVVQV